MLEYHLVTAELPLTAKTIDCVHETGPRKEAYLHAVCYRQSLLMFTKSVTVLVAVSKMEVVLVKHRSENQWTVLLGYLTISANVRCYYRL